MNPNILTPLRIQKVIKDPLLKVVLWLSIEKNKCCTLKRSYHVHILLINTSNQYDHSDMETSHLLICPGVIGTHVQSTSRMKIIKDRNGLALHKDKRMGVVAPPPPPPQFLGPFFTRNISPQTPRDASLCTALLHWGS